LNILTEANRRLALSPRRIAQVLKRRRREQELSQRALAKKAKTTGGYIARLETGRKRNPSLAVLQRLAKALGVPATELLG
jgi:transcriptional regulator with XRE-family HTH domain